MLVSPSTRGDSLIGRETGVRSVISSSFEVLPTLDTGGQISDAVYVQVSEVLMSYPKIRTIVCLNEYTTAEPPEPSAAPV